MVMKKASGGDSPLRQGAGKSFWTHPILRQRWRRLAVCFMEIDRAFRFSLSRRIYRRKVSWGFSDNSHGDGLTGGLDGVRRWVRLKIL
jgi:hypothetical protein